MSDIIPVDFGAPANFRGTDNGPVDPPCEGNGLEITCTLEDPVSSPSHYNRNGIETWDLIEHVICEYPDPTAAYHVASIHKYCDRAPYKENFYQDLRKAIQHAKRLEKYLDRVGK